MRTQSGHRQRVKDRFCKEGLENFADVHALELLLFYAIPRKDTKPVARRLLDTYGSVANVLQASPESLREVEGVGPGTATYLKLLSETMRYVERDSNDRDVIFNDINDCGQYLLKFLRGKPNEEVWLLSMDAKRKLISCQKICQGGPDAVSVSPRRAIELALSANASSVILAHNHPNGVALPSQEDVAITYRVAKGMNAVGIVLVDHIVVADGDFTSMYQNGGYDPKTAQHL